MLRAKRKWFAQMIIILCKYLYYANIFTASLEYLYYVFFLAIISPYLLMPYIALCFRTVTPPKCWGITSQLYLPWLICVLCKWPRSFKFKLFLKFAVTFSLTSFMPFSFVIVVCYFWVSLFKTSCFGCLTTTFNFWPCRLSVALLTTVIRTVTMAPASIHRPSVLQIHFLRSCLRN